MRKWAALFGITLVLALGIFGAKHFLLDANQDESRLGTPLGNVQSLKDELRYKHSSGVFWADAKVGQNLFNGTQIHTGPSGEARLLLHGKDTLQVPADTLLRLWADDKNPQSLSLNLDKGSFKIENLNPATTLQLRVGNAQVSLSSKSTLGFVAKKSEKGDVALAVISGDVLLQSGGQKKVLNQGEAVELKVPAASHPVATSSPTDAAKKPAQAATDKNASGDAAAAEGGALEMVPIERPKIQLLAPVDRHIFYDGGLDFFKWKAPADLKVILQISAENDFKRVLKQEEVTALSEFVIPKEMGPGTYFWRLIGDPANLPIYSDVRTFTLAKMVTAESGEPQLIFKSRGKWQLIVPVQGSKPNENYNFQVSRNINFTDLYDAFEGASPLKTVIDQPGNYFIRQRKSFGHGLYSEWSTPKAQFVRPPLEAPVFTLNSQELGSSEQNEMSLDWNPVEYSADYLVQIGEGLHFNKILKNIVIEKPPYTLRYSENVPGFLRVVARSVEGEYSPPSQVFEVKGVLRGPSIEVKEALPALYDKPGSSPLLHLLWGHRGGAQKYRVDVGRTPNLSDAQSVVTPNIEFNYEIKEDGWYYFRVWSLADENKYFLVPTPILAVKHGNPGPLMTPKKAIPKDNEVFLIPQGVPVSIKFTWSESPESEWYVLQLSRNKEFNAARELRVEGQEFVLKEALTSGQWYYRVRGRNKYRASAWSDVGVFYFGVSK